MTERPTVRIEPRALERLARDLMVAAGADAGHAAVAAELFVEADLHGVGAQGVDYLYYAMDGLKRGLIDGAATPIITRETPGAALIDGRRGIGQVAALEAVDIVARKARETGSAAVAIGNSTDIFRIGAFAMRLAKAGLIGFVTTSGPPLVHPHGGRERLLSTNPLAIGIPRRGDPFVLDMATSALASRGPARRPIMAKRCRPAPASTARGGRPPMPAPSARAARSARSAVIRASASGWPWRCSAGRYRLRHRSRARRLAGRGREPLAGPFLHGGRSVELVNADEFLDRTEWYIGVIKNSALAEGYDVIHIPFERSAAAARRQRQHGIAILDETWRVLQRLAAENGVALPQPCPARRA